MSVRGLELEQRRGFVRDIGFASISDRSRERFGPPPKCIKPKQDLGITSQEMERKKRDAKTCARRPQEP